MLVSQQPWGSDQDTANFDQVFGIGGYTFYSSFAAATPAAVFSGSNAFVMLEGGDGSDGAFASYVNTNAGTILSWVSGGGSLLLQSASWDRGPVTLGPGTISGPEQTLEPCGTLTGAGQAAFPTTPTSQCGNYLAHDSISGIGLTVFMSGDTSGLPIVAGTAWGAGYILYSGLTDSQFHNAGSSLVTNEIAFAAAQGSPVPEPGSLALLGLGLVGLSRRLRRRA